MMLCFGLLVCWLILGCLRSAEFTVPSLSAFNPCLHLSVSDVAFDVPFNPSCLQVCIKTSKTDPYRKGCNILIGVGSPPLCAVQAVVCYLARRGNCPGPLFLFQNGLPLTRSLLTDRLRAIILSAGLLGIFQATDSFRIGQPLLLRGLVFQITSSKCWVAGKAMRTNNIFELQLMF